MVEQQIALRGIRDPRLLAVMREIHRHRFVPPDRRGEAYEDRPLPIGEMQTISQPYMVALMTDALYVDHTLGAGTDLYRLTCQLDLEGIVAKRADSPYDNQTAPPPWIEIKNPTYTQSRSKGLLKRASYGTTPRAA